MEVGGESFNQRVGQCLVWEKVKEGHVHLITTEDIEELFHAFEVYGEKIPTSELVRLCSVDGTHLSAEDIAEWIKDSDKDGTGEVSVEDVHKGITEGAAAFSLVKRALFGEEKEPAPSCLFSMLLSLVGRNQFKGMRILFAAHTQCTRSTKSQSAAFMSSSTGCTMNMTLAAIKIPRRI
eukprot:Skav212602  [mRNA]  locus=scaffold2176:89091:89627:- [translate_table: standard]